MCHFWIDKDSKKFQCKKLIYLHLLRFFRVIFFSVIFILLNKKNQLRLARLLKRTFHWWKQWKLSDEQYRSNVCCDFHNELIIGLFGDWYCSLIRLSKHFTALKKLIIGYNFHKLVGFKSKRFYMKGIVSMTSLKCNISWSIVKREKKQFNFSHNF